MALRYFCPLTWQTTGQRDAPTHPPGFQTQGEARGSRSSDCVQVISRSQQEVGLRRLLVTGQAAQQNGERTAALWRRGLATQTAAKSVRRRAHGIVTVPSKGSRCATVDGAAAHARLRGDILGSWYKDSGFIASQCEGRACARGLHSRAHWCPRISALATCREGDMCIRVSCCYNEQQRTSQAIRWRKPHGRRQRACAGGGGGSGVVPVHSSRRGGTTSGSAMPGVRAWRVSASWRAGVSTRAPPAEQGCSSECDGRLTHPRRRWHMTTSQSAPSAHTGRCGVDSV